MMSHMRSIVLLAGLTLAGCTDRFNITITQLQITDDYDAFGTPEIEVYMFRGTELIACAGSRQGLAEVDDAGVRYELNSLLVDDERDTDIALGGGAFRFEVWEDDDDPVCPKYPDPALNDVLGVGPALTLSKWLAFEGEHQFGTVAAFSVRFD